MGMRGPTVDFVEFHQRMLPQLMTPTRCGATAEATAGLGSLALRLSDGTAFTYERTAVGLAIRPGDATAGTIIEMDHESWQGLVEEVEAAAGLLYAGRVRCLRGNAMDFMAWESGLRALYNGRPPFDPARRSLIDRDGGALKLETIFSFTAERRTMAHFLDTTGYLFVRGVFADDEVAAFRDEADELAREARPGDKLSWWGRDARGTDLLCRVTRGSSKPRLATLPGDTRLQQLKALGDAQFVHKRGEGEGVTVIFKRPGMTEGLGDLPWHRDCGMGGHATMCPILVASIFLTAATPESGELAMLPGSHKTSFNAHDRRTDANHHAAHFRARAGDVSLHHSDTVHAAPPPTQAGRDGYRISAIVSFAHPAAHHHRGEASYNDVLHQRDDGQIEHLETRAKRL